MLQRGRTERAISLLRAFVALEPDVFLGRQILASAYRRAGRPVEALAQYREASRLLPDVAGPLVAMASIHATDPDPEVRDAARAVELAERAAQLAPTGSPVVAETLAAAYAGDGRLERALEVLQLAIDALPEQRNGERRRLERQLVRYREGGD